MSPLTESCPKCNLSRVAHVWRTDMKNLCWIDEWKCLACGHRWGQHSTPRKLPIER